MKTNGKITNGLEKISEIVEECHVKYKTPNRIIDDRIYRQIKNALFAL